MSFERPPELRGRLQFLDALRGIAALAVMIFHFYAEGVSPLHKELSSVLPGWVDGLLGNFWIGVEVFFVLSGFVIASSMDGQEINLSFAGNFILRRSLRLDPPYWTAMFLSLFYLLCLWPTQLPDLYLEFGGVKGLLANMFYVQNIKWIYPAKSVLDVSWTLCLEVQFYLSFLLIVIFWSYVAREAATESRRRQVFLAGTGLMVLGIAIWSLSMDLMHHSFGFSGRSWSFFLGVLVYGAIRQQVRALPVVAVLVILLASFIFAKQARSIGTACTALTIYLVASSGRLHSLLAWRWLLYFGHISYSIYLIHNVVGMAVLGLLGRMGGGSVAFAWLTFAVAIAVTILAADRLHHFVEGPSNRISAKFKHKRHTERLLAKPSIS